MLLKSLCLLVAVGLAVSAKTCNMPPSLWCSTRETAENCGVRIQKTSIYVPQDKKEYPHIFFLFLHANICCGYSLEVSHRGTSNEYQQCFCKKTKQKYFMGTH